MGWARDTKLAMLQILRLAPSMTPDIEPVVSRANTRSTRGRGAGCCASAGGGVADGSGGISTRRTGGAAGAGGAAAAPWCWAASAATPVRTAPMMRLRLTHLSLFLSLLLSLDCM